MAEDLASGSFDGRDPAQAGEGSLATQPLGVVFKATISSVVGAYACQRDQLRGDLRHQLVEFCASSSAISLERAS
jgi:hypothetical protein